jgi:succinylglutamic semialdehyde dehydrogenase
MSIEPTVDRAVRGALEALEHWSTNPSSDRVSVLHAYADQLRAQKANFVQTICEETGKPRWESATEVDAMINKVALSIRAQQERRREDASESGPGVTAATRYKPHGVCAVLGPFNFPGHLPNGHIVPALLAGNTVVFKPSELTPRVGRQMVELWQAAGLPQGVLHLVEGAADIGRSLVTHPWVNGVFFTGSFRVGREINRLLADTPRKIAALEMGGNNPLVVWDVADFNAAAYMTIQSAYVTAGQRCSCARRLIVSKGSSGDRFIEALIAMMSRIRVGLFIDEPEPFMGPVINEASATRLLAAQQEMIDLAAEPLVPMRKIDRHPAMLSPGLLDVSRLFEHEPDEEIFGPLLRVIRVDDFDAAIWETNNTSFGLAAGLLSDDRELWERFYRRARAGVVNWNRPLTGASSALPFGGVGDSGNHRPSAFFAADYCSYPVASLESNQVVMPATLTPGIDL